MRKWLQALTDQLLHAVAPLQDTPEGRAQSRQGATWMRQVILGKLQLFGSCQKAHLHQTPHAEMLTAKQGVSFAKLPLPPLHQ